MPSAPIHEQLRVEVERRGWTLPELITRSGLRLSVSGLSLKLRGKRPMWTAEAERLLQTLDLRLVWAPDRSHIHPPAAEAA